MMKPALQYLVLRSLGAPAVLLSLAMQGVFRGLKDTKTPLYATGIVIFHIFKSKLYVLGKLNSDESKVTPQWWKKKMQRRVFSFT
jgi:Na+-driven multidrug efflux pump